MSDIVAARFLDPTVFHKTQLEVPDVDVTIPKGVTDAAGNVLDIQTTARMFFESTHTWMPILSRKQFFANLPRRILHKRPELYLLVLSMKLCYSHVTVAKTTLYRVTKQFYFDLETSGKLSIQILQAGIFIALYEFGHAIYPAGLLSIGSSARYATLLGIDKSLVPSNDSNLSWIDEEERRRAWWSILILDRLVLKLAPVISAGVEAWTHNVLPVCCKVAIRCISIQLFILTELFADS